MGMPWMGARSISFKHPASGKEMTFEAKVPGFFNDLMGSRD
jgi:hypothetical protein